MALRYDLELRSELEKSINRFNAKVDRLARQQRDLILPEKLSYYDIVDSARSKKDLQEKLSEIKRFSKRGVEETITTKGGVDISRYEMENLRIESRRVKQRLTREINKLEKITPTSLGVKQDFSLKTIPTDRLINLRARRKSLEKDINLLQGEEFQYYIQKIQSNKRRSRYRDLQYQNAYIDKMLLNLGYMVGYDSKKLDEIRKKLSTLSTSEFLKLMDTEKVVQVVQNYYDETQDKVKRNKNVTKNTISDIYEKYDMLYDNLDKILDSYK